ncbi:hypothetical protein [Mesorhizobium comanense]|uniref:hypothetical protein n=1 Tax=Mesorhizobium comanense TaxID=2502215 RepID=UPI0010F4540A|nr:hypothetical protein [Mesorhizobium comanense]
MREPADQPAAKPQPIAKPMRTADWNFTVCALLIVTLGMIAATFVNQASFGQAAMQPTSGQMASIDLFNRIATVIQHPRCMNCHTSTDFPGQGDDSHGLHDTGTAAVQCATCHQGATRTSDAAISCPW